MSNFFVTGGCGYVGSALADFLIRKNHCVRSIDVVDPINPFAGVEYLKGSICDKALIQTQLKNIDCVYHNAVYIPYFSKKKLMYDINIEGLKILLDSCIENSVKKVIITSSSCVFGNNAKMPIQNHINPSPADNYGKIRYLAEQVALEYVKKGLNIVIFRPHLIAGVKREGIFTSIFKRIANGQDLWLPHTIGYVHQFIHIDDYIQALWLALEYPHSDIFNIGTASNYSIKSLIEDTIKKIGSSSRIRIIPSFVLNSIGLIDSMLGCSILGSHAILTKNNGFVFDCSYLEEKLNFSAVYSDYDIWSESFNWFVKNQKTTVSGEL